MNNDQVKGALEAAVGRLQRNAGESLGSARPQARGLAKEFQGKAQRKVGKAKDALKVARGKLVPSRDRPMRVRRMVRSAIDAAFVQKPPRPGVAPAHVVVQDPLGTLSAAEIAT